MPSLPGSKSNDGGSDSRFFTTQKKGEMHELRMELHSTDRNTKVDAVKKVIASMTVGMMAIFALLGLIFLGRRATKALRAFATSDQPAPRHAPRPKLKKKMQGRGRYDGLETSDDANTADKDDTAAEEVQPAHETAATVDAHSCDAHKDNEPPIVQTDARPMSSVAAAQADFELAPLRISRRAPPLGNRAAAACWSDDEDETPAARARARAERLRSTSVRS